jgi:hypothetical protein
MPAPQLPAFDPHDVPESKRHQLPGAVPGREPASIQSTPRRPCRLQNYGVVMTRIVPGGQSSHRRVVDEAMAVASAGRKADMPIHDKMSSSTCSKARSHLKPIPDSKFSRPGCAPPEAEQRLGLARHACVDSTGEGETFGFHRRDIRRATAGLTYRPLPLTAADTLAWFVVRGRNPTRVAACTLARSPKS